MPDTLQDIIRNTDSIIDGDPDDWGTTPPEYDEDIDSTLEEFNF